MFVRMSRPSFIILVLLMVVAIPMWLSSKCSNQPILAELFETFFLTSPLLPSLIAYFLIRDQLANSKSLNDGEYMTLLFTRPLTRANYVLTKWTASGTLVSLLVFVQFVVFHTCQSLAGRSDTLFNSWCGLADIVLNSFGVTAAIMVINSLPPKVGTFVLVGLLYASMLISAIPQMQFSADHGFLNIIGQAGSFMQSFMNPTIQTSAALNSVRFSCLPFLTYLSNVCTYLTLAVLILSKREFFYASN